MYSIPREVPTPLQEKGSAVKKIITPCLIALIPAMLSFPVLAQEEGAKRDRFKINVGAFFIRSTETTIRLDQTNGLIGSGSVPDIHERLGPCISPFKPNRGLSGATSPRQRR